MRMKKYIYFYDDSAIEENAYYKSIADMRDEGIIGIGWAIWRAEIAENGEIIGDYEEFDLTEEDLK